MPKLGERKVMAPLVCLNCGMAKSRRNKRGHYIKTTKFCSVQCSAKYKAKRGMERIPPTFKCAWCGKEKDRPRVAGSSAFIMRRRFCGKSCSMTATAAQRNTGPLTFKCRGCGVESAYKKSKKGFLDRSPVYCGRKCSSQNRMAIDSPDRRTSNGYHVLTRNGKTRLLHRVIMEKILGRELFRHENVHHINSIKTDNRPENLELWTVSQPPGSRVSDKIAWAKEFLAQYGFKVTAELSIVSADEEDKKQA